MKRNRYAEDSVLNEFVENYHRAGVTLLLAVVFFVAWLAVWWLGAGNPSQIGATFNSIVGTVLGWASVIFFGLSLLQYVYAYLYPRIVSTKL